MKGTSSFFERIKKFSQKVANTQAKMMLFVFYFFFLPPFSILVKIFYNPVGIKLEGKKSNWLEKENFLQNIEDLRKQF